MRFCTNITVKFYFLFVFCDSVFYGCVKNKRLISPQLESFLNVCLKTKLNPSRGKLLTQIQGLTKINTSILKQNVEIQALSKPFKALIHKFTNFQGSVGTWCENKEAGEELKVLFFCQLKFKYSND